MSQGNQQSIQSLEEGNKKRKNGGRIRWLSYQIKIQAPVDDLEVSRAWERDMRQNSAAVMGSRSSKRVVASRLGERNYPKTEGWPRESPSAAFRICGMLLGVWTEYSRVWPVG